MISRFFDKCIVFKVINLYVFVELFYCFFVWLGSGKLNFNLFRICIYKVFVILYVVFKLGRGVREDFMIFENIRVYELNFEIIFYFCW